MLHIPMPFCLWLKACAALVLCVKLRTTVSAISSDWTFSVVLGCVVIALLLRPWTVRHSRRSSRPFAAALCSEELSEVTWENIAHRLRRRALHRVILIAASDLLRGIVVCTIGTLLCVVYQSVPLREDTAGGAQCLITTSASASRDVAGPWRSVVRHFRRGSGAAVLQVSASALGQLGNFVEQANPQKSWPCCSDDHTRGCCGQCS